MGWRDDPLVASVTPPNGSERWRDDPITASATPANGDAGMPNNSAPISGVDRMPRTNPFAQPEPANEEVPYYIARDFSRSPLGKAVTRMGEDFQAREQRIQRLKGRAIPVATGIQSAGELTGAALADIPMELFRPVVEPAMKGAIGLGDVLIGGLPVPGAEGTVREELPKSLESLGRTGRSIAEYTEENYPSLAALFYGGAGAAEGLLGTKSVQEGVPLAGESIAKGAVKTGRVATAPVRGTYKGIKKVGEGITARSPEQLEGAIEDIVARAGPLFEQAERPGVTTISPTKKSDIIKNIGSTVKLDPTKQSTRLLYGDLVATLEDATVDLGRKQGAELSDLYDLRKTLQAVEQKSKVSNPAQAKLAGQARRKLDEEIAGLSEADLVSGDLATRDALVQGISEWAKAKRLEEVSDIIRKAEGDPNKIRAASKRLYENKKKIQGFTPEEREVIRAMAYPGFGGTLLKALGNFGFDLSSTARPLLTLAAGGASAATGGSLGIPAAVLTGAGTLARQGRKYATRAEPERLFRMIEGRAAPEVRAAPRYTAEDIIGKLQNK